MIKQHYQTLFGYSGHTAARLLQKAALSSDADLYSSPGYGHGSIYDLFFHLLASSHGWRVAIETGQQPRRLKSAAFERLPAVADALSEEFDAWQRLLAKATDEESAAPMTLLTLRGAESKLVYWRVLQHLTLHFMQHHTEIAQLLTLKGQSPGDLDFLFYDD